MRYHLKQFMILLMSWTGIIRLFQFVHRNKIVIWTIHGVMDEQDNPSWVPLRPQLSRKKLDEYLRVLSKRYHFISLTDAVEMLQGRKPMQPYSMVFTFDDGYRNNLTHALPILRRYNAPATFFIATGYADNPRPFWWDRLDYAVQHAQVNGRDAKVGDLAVRLDSSSREALRESFKRLRRDAKKQQTSDMSFRGDMDKLAGTLEAESDRALSELQNEDDWSAVMTWEEVERNGNSDITFGSHTVDHIRLGLVDIDMARDQLEKSKSDIEKHTGESCLSLCYPSGSFTEEAVDLARRCGYLYGVTTKEGLNHIGMDVMMLRRIGMPGNTTCADLLYCVSVARR